MHVHHLLLQRLQLDRGQRALHAFHHLAPVAAIEQLPLRGAVRVAQRDAHQEPVQLRFGQGEGAELVVRVLRRDDEEGRGQGAGFAFDRDLLFFHRLEQCALGLGAGSVDLVGEQHLRENRARVEHEALLAALVDGDAGQVAGHQVGGELHAGKLQPEGAGQRVRQRGLADAGNVLDQQVPAGQQACHAVLHLVRFAHDHRVKLAEERLDFLLCIHGATLSEFMHRRAWQ